MMSKETTVEFKCDQCGQVIAIQKGNEPVAPGYLQYAHHIKAVAVECDSTFTTLTFYAWSDEVANVDGTLLFHNKDCATRYLSKWLSEQAEKEKPVPEETDVVAYQSPPAVPEDVFSLQAKLNAEAERVTGALNIIGEHPRHVAEIGNVKYIEEAEPADVAGEDDEIPY